MDKKKQESWTEKNPNDEVITTKSNERIVAGTTE